jgi:hypothetical protein
VKVDHDAAGPCLPHLQIELHLRLAQRRIEIGQEVVKQPCLYDAVLEHYRKKADADEAAYKVYVAWVAAALRETAFSGQAANSDTGLDETVRTQARQWAKSIVDQGWDLAHGARVAAQRAVDTPEEMRRLAQACGPDA